MITAILKSDLKDIKHHPIFNLDYIVKCPDIPDNVLEPTWEDSTAYTIEAKKLAQMFVENFKKFPEAKSLIKYGPSPT